MKFVAGALLIALGLSHPARGAWIEMRDAGGITSADWSHPARGAWIEINTPRGAAPHTESHPARGAWIEICYCKQITTGLSLSHPARGAWIEIQQEVADYLGITVAPRKGCVD